MEPSLVTIPIIVDRNLRQMGLTRDDIIEAIRYAESERALCTDNDPIGFKNMVAYARAGRRLREIFCKVNSDWEIDNSHNQCAIRNKRTKVRVVPCNFNDDAGNQLVTPSNKSPKGEVTRKKSACNKTAWLPGIVEEGAPIDVDGYKTWVLGIYIDDSRPTTAELSMPIDFDGRFFTNFGTRIILLDGKEQPNEVRAPQPLTSFGVIDIQVNRK